MIEELAERASIYFSNKNIIDRNKQEIYKYGFELLISTIFNVVGILIISGILRVVLGAVLFIIAFVPLRLSAGGYHAKHHWSCILGFNIIFLCFALLLKYLNTDFMRYYSLVSIMVCSIFIWSFAPVEAANKPLKQEQREKQKKHSVIISSVNLAIVLTFFALPNLPSNLLAYYISGALSASGLLVIPKISKKTDG